MRQNKSLQPFRWQRVDVALGHDENGEAAGGVGMPEVVPSLIIGRETRFKSLDEEEYTVLKRVASLLLSSPLMYSTLTFLRARTASAPPC